MEIKTKFAIGDKVWTISGCKTVWFEIRSISISPPMAPGPKLRITYCGAYNDGKITTADESECFATKEELIEYITSDD